MDNSAISKHTCGKTRVLIIGESAVIGGALTEIINGHAELEVVGTAADPIIACEKIRLLRPDVLMLEVEVQRMDGYQVLDNLMRLYPLSVVIISPSNREEAIATRRELQLGTVNIMRKPSGDMADGLLRSSTEVCEKILDAATATVVQHAISDKLDKALASDVACSDYPLAESLLAFGASTGGTRALEDVFRELPPDTPGCVVVQHLPVGFSAAFAKKLDQCSAMRIAQAVDGERIVQGHAYVAPGNRHLEVVKDGDSYYCRLSDADPVSRYRPSVDVLFNSLAECASANSVGVILTGMGRDGAGGLLNLRNGGASTIAQDEKTSVVWGMPGTAVSLGAVDNVLPLANIAKQICCLLSLQRVA